MEEKEKRHERQQHANAQQTNKQKCRNTNRWRRKIQYRESKRTSVEEWSVKTDTETEGEMIATERKRHKKGS